MTGISASHKSKVEDKVRIGIRWFSNIFAAVATIGIGFLINLSVAEFDKGWILPVLGMIFAVIGCICFIFFDIVLNMDMPRLFKFSKKTNILVAVGAIGGLILTLAFMIINLVVLNPPIN